jgi:hypothetical protein
MVVLALVASSGCTSGSRPEGDAPTEQAKASADAEARATSPAWSIEAARVDRIPEDPPPMASRLPAAFPPDDSVLPDLLTDPPGRALLAYHPRESFDDRGGWASERVFFFGTDGQWRSLDMDDLALPESTHPGIDTYGAGQLSPDGARWAAPTRAGIVLLDLRTARTRVVLLPGAHTQYLAWHPDGRDVGVVRLSGASTHRTWSVHARSRDVAEAAYGLPIDGFAPDGSVVTFTRRGADTLRTAHRDGDREVAEVAVPHRLARYGGAVGQERTVFGLNRQLVAVEDAGSAPLARLRLGPGDAAGWPRGWWGPDTLWFHESRRGLLTWNVVSGEVRRLTRVRAAARPDTWWSASVAVGLMR